MKRLVVAVLAMMVCFTGCSKDEEIEQEQGKVTPENVFRGKRVAEINYGNSYEKYTYDQNGRLISAKIFYGGDVLVEETLTYENNKLTVIGKEGGVIVSESSFVINENGFIDSGIIAHGVDDISSKYTISIEMKY